MLRHLSLWLSWCLASATGGAVIGALSAPTDFFWYLIMTGFVVGVAQWLVLRRYLPYAGWWILVSAFGWILGTVTSIMTREITAPIIEFFELISEVQGVFWLNVVNGTVYGAVLGVTQWLVLRRHTQRAGWWVFASAIGGAVNGGVGAVCAAAIPFGGAALPYGAGWAGAGAVTGIVLVWLLHHIQNL